MKRIIISGTATITDKGFSFDSNIPAGIPILERPIKMKGTLQVNQNASADFSNHEPVALPPEVYRVSDGEGYRVKRTSRNYIIQIKVPVVETRKKSEQRIKSILPVIMSEITLDRHELMD